MRRWRPDAGLRCLAWALLGSVVGWLIFGGALLALGVRIIP